MATGAKVTAAAPVRLVPIAERMNEAIERLLDLSFGYDRHRRTAYRLRERVAAVADLSCAALDAHGRLVGSLQSWPLALVPDEGAATPLWLVGPIAVDPARQGQGIGRAMLGTGLRRDRPHAARRGADRRPGLLRAVRLFRRCHRRLDDARPGRAPSPARPARPGATLPACGLLGPRPA